MPTINQLSAVSELSAGDLVAIFSTNNGDARKASLSVLASFIQSQITAADNKLTQYSAPSATGFTVNVEDGSDSVWLILTPVAGYATGTIKLPAVANAVDKQEVLINCTQLVTSLTVDGNGATVTGEPATLVANDFFRLRFDGVTETWYRVG
jgi:hypothetical protein